MSGPTITDMFAGLGGSSLGAELAGGQIRLALNHWPLAVKNHNTNFPHADHDCTDLSACNPGRYYGTDILIASPECTNHSIAKGRKRKNPGMPLFGEKGYDPAEERSRATMWDVPRFCEKFRYYVELIFKRGLRKVLLQLSLTNSQRLILFYPL